jgi:hypothetical protein
VSRLRVQSLIIYFASLAPIEPVYIANASIDKGLGGTCQCQQSLTLGHTDITEAHGGVIVDWDRWSAPTCCAPEMCSPCRIQGISEMMRTTTRKRTRQRTMRLVLHAVFFIQHKDEVLSAHILMMWTPVSSLNVMAHVRGREDNIDGDEYQFEGGVWRPSHPGCG